MLDCTEIGNEDGSQHVGSCRKFDIRAFDCDCTAEYGKGRLLALSCIPRPTCVSRTAGHSTQCTQWASIVLSADVILVSEIYQLSSQGGAKEAIPLQGRPTGQQRIVEAAQSEYAEASCIIWIYSPALQALWSTRATTPKFCESRFVLMGKPLQLTPALGKIKVARLQS